MADKSVVSVGVTTREDADTAISGRPTVTTLAALEAPPGSRAQVEVFQARTNPPQISDYRLCNVVMKLYDELHAPMRAHLRRYGVQGADAEDVIHEAFLRLLYHLKGGGAEENLRGWLFQVAYNLSVDLFRLNRHYLHLSTEETDGASRPEEPPDPAPDPQEVAIARETNARFLTAIAELTPQQQRCLLLRAEGLRYKQIAAILGVSIARVAKLIEHSTTFLAERL
jgi:RNA polymerase sigma-70 factor, ECF subfamily